MCLHVRPADPRKTHIDGSFSCMKCGRLVVEGMTPRTPALEQELTRLAARAAGSPEAAAVELSRFADARAWPGGIRADIDHDREALEEFADARHYLVWGIIDVYPGVLAGDPLACDAYERRMRALAKVVAAFAELLSPSS